MGIKVAVLMPVYYRDNPSYVEVAIRSILRQSHSSDLFIVCDGELTTNLDHILEKYSEDVNVLRKVENTGLADTLNFGLSVVKKYQYDFIARMDSDDLSARDRIKRQVDYMRKQDLQVCGTNYVMCNERQRQLVSMPADSSDAKKSILILSPLCHPSVVFRADIVDKIVYPTDTARLEDYALWIVLLRLNVRIGNLQEPLLYFRYDSSTAARRAGFRQAISQLRVRAAAIDIYSGSKTVGWTVVILRFFVVIFFGSYWYKLVLVRTRLLRFFISL